MIKVFSEDDKAPWLTFRRTMEKYNVKSKQLAKLLDVSEVTVNKWRRGDAAPNNHQRDVLRDYFVLLEKLHGNKAAGRKSRDTLLRLYLDFWTPLLGPEGAIERAGQFLSIPIPDVQDILDGKVALGPRSLSRLRAFANDVGVGEQARSA